MKFDTESPICAISRPYNSNFHKYATNGSKNLDSRNTGWTSPTKLIGRQWPHPQLDNSNSIGHMLKSFRHVDKLLLNNQSPFKQSLNQPKPKQKKTEIVPQLHQVSKPMTLKQKVELAQIEAKNSVNRLKQSESQDILRPKTAIQKHNYHRQLTNITPRGTQSTFKSLTTLSRPATARRKSKMHICSYISSTEAFVRSQYPYCGSCSSGLPLKVNIAKLNIQKVIQQMEQLIAQGSEGRVFEFQMLSQAVVVKERFVKKYRQPVLDEKLGKKRTLQEARNILKARKAGVCVPAIILVDLENRRLYLERIQPSISVKDLLIKLETLPESLQIQLARYIGQQIAKLHDCNCIHGDLTTTNMLIKFITEGGIESILRDDYISNVHFIDFGLSFVSSNNEDKAVDLYVLEKAVISAHPNFENLVRRILNEYKQASKKGDAVLEKLHQVRSRGRKRLAFG